MPGVPHVGQRVEAKTDGNGVQPGTVLAVPANGKCKVRFDINGQAYDVPLNLLRPAQGAAAAAPAQQQAAQPQAQTQTQSGGAQRVGIGSRVDAVTDGHGTQGGVIVGAPQPNGNIKVKFDINGQSYDVPMRLLRAPKQLPTPAMPTMASQPGPSAVSSQQMDRWLQDSDDEGMGGKNGRSHSNHPNQKNAKALLHEWCQKHAHLIDAGTKMAFTVKDKSEAQTVVEVELFLRKTRFAFTAAGTGKDGKKRKKNAKTAAAELMYRKLTGDPQIVALCRQFPPKNSKITKGTFVFAVKQIAHQEGGFVVNPGDKGLVMVAHETGGKYTIQWDKHSNYSVPAFYDQITPVPRKKKGKKKKKKKKTTHSGGFGKAGKNRKKKVKTRGAAIANRSGKKFHEGQSVLVKVKGKWTDGKIEELESSGKYCVYVQAADNHITVSHKRIKARKMNDWASSMYEDVNENGPSGGIPAGGGMFAAPWAQSKVFNEGQTVYAKWKGKTEYHGVVDSVNGDGTYRIYWPKWKNHSNCPAKDIRPRKGSKSSGMDAFDPY